MSTRAAVSRATTNAVIAHLSAGATPMLVGDGEAPSGLDGTRPHLIVDVMASTVRDGLVRDDRWVAHVIQVRAVGMTREAAEYARDISRGVMLARDLTVTGATVHDIDLELSNPVSRDPDGTDPRWTATDRFAIHVEGA